MVNPANLNVVSTKKKNIGLRINEDLADKLTEIAKIEDTTTTEIITGLITDFLEDKVVYNNYLETKEEDFILIPYNPTAKEIAIDDLLVLNKSDKTLISNLFNTVDSMYLQVDNSTNLDNLKIYESKYIPNNLDYYDTETRSYVGSITGLHNGLEPVVISEVAGYYEEVIDIPADNEIITKVKADYTECLYLLYYDVVKNTTEVYLIDYLTAIKYCKIAGNDYLFNLINNITNELTIARSIEEVEAIANKYNTGNVIKLDDKEPVEVKPLKLATINNQNVIKQHDKEILEELTSLRKSNKELEAKLNKITEVAQKQYELSKKLKIENKEDLVVKSEK